MKLKSGMRGKHNGLLDLIAELPDKITMVEVGCYAGESTVMFADSGKFDRIYCVDPWDEQKGKRMKKTERFVYDNIEWAEKSFDIRMKGKNIEKYKMTFAEAVRLIAPVDFIYIDAKHTYKEVKETIILAKKCLKPNGIIAGHDYGETFPGVKKAVDDLFGKPSKVYKDTSWII